MVVAHMVQVVLCPGIPAHWALLKARLEKICPSGQAATSLWRWTSDRVEVQHPFLLQVSEQQAPILLLGRAEWAMCMCLLLIVHCTPDLCHAGEHFPVQHARARSPAQ